MLTLKNTTIIYAATNGNEKTITIAISPTQEEAIRKEEQRVYSAEFGEEYKGSRVSFVKSETSKFAGCSCIKLSTRFEVELKNASEFRDLTAGSTIDVAVTCRPLENKNYKYRGVIWSPRAILARHLEPRKSVWEIMEEEGGIE